MTIPVPTLTLTPRRSALAQNCETELDVLVQVTPPECPPETRGNRPPLHLALVIDRSGSMSGRPIAEARNAAAFVINGLSDADRAAIVVYDDHVNTLMPLSDMTRRPRLLDVIRTVDTGGCTNLHGGWTAGVEALARHTAADVISRVILLSDGCANSGVTDVGTISAQCAELAAAGVSTSTYGLGANFNEDLMIGMARSGLGNHYYGQTAQDLMDPFREELALLNALYAREVCLSLRTAPGVSAKVLNGYATQADGAYRLPDLAYRGEAWAVVRVRVPADLAAAPIESLLTATLRCRDLENRAICVESVLATLPTLPAAAFAVLPEVELVARRATELNFADLQERARTAAQQRQWATVERLLAEARILAADNPWLEGMVTELNQLARLRDDVMFAKEAVYSASRLRTRLSDADEQLSIDVDAPAFLRRKFAQGKAQPDGNGGNV